MKYTELIEVSKDRSPEEWVEYYTTRKEEPIEIPPLKGGEKGIPKWWLTDRVRGFQAPVQRKRAEEIWFKILPSLEKNCSKIIDVYRTNKQCRRKLVRGTKNKNIFFKGSSREGRKPIDMPREIQIDVDEILTEMGISVLRSNSYFTTGGIPLDRYGDTYVIFPLNGFKFLWFEKSIDLYAEIKNILNPGKRFKTNVKKMELIERKEKIRELVLGFKPIYNKRLKSAICSNNEVMLTGEYYAFDTLWFQELISSLIRN